MNGQRSMSKAVVLLMIAASLAMLVVLGQGDVMTVRTGAAPTTVEPPSVTDNDLGVVGLHVRVDGEYNDCSGVPIRNTNLVVTATHCVLQPLAGTVSSPIAVSVVLDGVQVDLGRALIVPTSYLLDRHPSWDVALIVTGTTWTEHGVDEWGGWPPSGTYEVFGLQLVNPDGVRIGRDNPLWDPCDSYDCANEPELRRYLNQLALASWQVTSCTGEYADVMLTSDGAGIVRCGLLSGGSGGPVVEYLADGRVRLVGVVSTMCDDECQNGIAPASLIDMLLSGDPGVLHIPLQGTDPGASAAANT